MTSRKSMTDALSPEKEAFIKGTAPQGQDTLTEETTAGVAMQGRRGRITITVRLEPDVADALFQASADRKMKQLTPYTQQDIVSEALKKWLGESGFWG